MNNKEINIIFFSDTHLGFDYPLRPRGNKPHRGEDFFKNFEAVLLYAKTNKIDLVIHGGDLFFRSKVPNPIIDRVYQTLLTFANHEIPVYIVPGNHERSRLPTSLFLNHKFIHVFDIPKAYSVTIKNTRIIIYGFPFIRENVRGKFQSIIHQSGWTNDFSDIKILVFHQAIEGASVGPGNYTFRDSPEVIPLSHLPLDVNVILCGHIHRQQRLVKTTTGNNSPIPIIFSGSTERTSFAEKDEEKGFCYLNFINDERQNWRLKTSRFIALSSRPMKDIFIDPELEVQKLDSYLKREISQIDQNAIIRFRSIKPLRKDLAKVMTSKNLRQLLPSGVNFQFSSNIFNSFF